MKKLLIVFTFLLFIGCNTVKKEVTQAIVNDFADYIIGGDYKKVKEMLGEYNGLVDSNAILESGNYKPLSIASWVGNKEIMQLLIDEGAEVNAFDETGDFPLYLAIYDNDVSVVTLLIKNGAEVNLKNRDGMTALHHASYVGNLEIVKVLFDNGAEQSYMNDGCDSVTEAVDGGNLEILKFLYKKGYNFNYLDNEGLSPLLSAVFNSGNEDIIEYLIEINVNLDIRGENNYTAIYYDMLQNDGLYLELLLKGGADPNITPEHNFSLLHEYVTRKQLYKVKILLKYNANPNLQDQTGRTPLDYAKELPEDETSKKIVSLLEEVTAY